MKYKIKYKNILKYKISNVADKFSIPTISLSPESSPHTLLLVKVVFVNDESLIHFLISIALL